MAGMLHGTVFKKRAMGIKKNFITLKISSSSSTRE
jgi:hypothetical protein